MPCMISIILGDRLNERLAKVLADAGLTEQQFLLAILDAELVRREKSRKPKKEHRPKNPVGRPRLTAKERQFRINVREIDEIYLSLENEYLTKPGVFQELFGQQLAIYKELVEKQDHDAIQWWMLNAPWQKKNPADFNYLWSNRESKADTVTSNRLEGA